MFLLLGNPLQPWIFQTGATWEIQVGALLMEAGRVSGTQVGALDFFLCCWARFRIGAASEGVARGACSSGLIGFLVGGHLLGHKLELKISLLPT